jgi:hypothetical protein
MLLNGKGPNSTTFVDSSNFANSITTSGNAVAASPGGASPIYPRNNNAFDKAIYFDGVNSRISASGTSWRSLPGDFTIEMWSYQISASGLKTQFEFGSTNFTEYGIMIRPSTNVIGVGYASTPSVSAAMNVTNNTWIHWAIARFGSTVRIYKNGVSIASGSFSGTLTANSGAGIYLGDSVHAPGRFWNGYIDDFRITKGVARYQGSSFSVPTAPLPNI